MKILMVCLGNICRSPLAEGIMKSKANKYKLEIEVDSAGTAAYHAGEMPDPRSMEVAAKNGIDLSYQRARKFQPVDFEKFDKIFAMDRYNFSDLAAQARNGIDTGKIDMILNITSPGENRDVPDPYYGGKDGFDKVYKMLDDACEIIAKEIAANGLEKKSL
ncbi:MAG: low molecular weight protein-tyrosine-phosphatase [Bacteroidales bacterium]